MKATQQRVILFTFAGRQPNLELQLPMARRILEDHPNVHYHVWNFARNNQDRAFIKTISGERITVWNGSGEDGFASPITTGVVGAKQFGAGEHNAAYRHYSQPEFEDCLFVKIDDDIVFLETARFGKFVEAIDTHRGSALVANIFNNGACIPVNPGLWERFQALRIPLLDMHLSNKFCELAHTYLFDNYQNILNQPIELVPTEDWLSINAVGYDWKFLRHVLKVIGTPHPPYLAGRNMHGWGRCFGDEGVFQTLPRMIMKGFTAGHISYGPQNPTRQQMESWLQSYRELGELYLGSEMSTKDDSVGLPELSEVSCGYVGVRGYEALTGHAPDWRSRWLNLPPHSAGDVNDPTVGRFRP